MISQRVSNAYSRGMGAVNDIVLRLGRATTEGRRSENQDRDGFFQCGLGEGFLVADGMGGYEGGATAAQIVVNRLPELLQTYPADADVFDAISDATRQLNQDLQDVQRSAENLRQMGSTMVLALWKDRRLWVAHAGDSRAYLFREGALRRLTTDHTVAQQKIGADATDEEVRQHPGHSVLTRVVGQRGDLIPEIHGPYSLLQGDGLLLCSDGLSGFATDMQIQELLRQGGDAVSLSQRLKDMALEIGSSDNVTVQYVEVLPAPSATPAFPALSVRWLWIVLGTLLGCTFLWIAWHVAGDLLRAAKPALELKFDPH